jgi:hypothetical protein
MGVKQMAPDHQLSETVYQALKADLLSDKLHSNRLGIQTLEIRYQTSATPVREALLRLVGEGLIEMRPAGGFGPPHFDEHQIYDLYELNLRIMLSTVSWRNTEEGAPSIAEQGNSRPSIEEVFSIMGACSGNSALIALIDSMNCRLRPIRRIEHAIMGTDKREIETMYAHFIRGSKPQLRRSIIAFHRRRLRYSIEIAAQYGTEK